MPSQENFYKRRGNTRSIFMSNGTNNILESVLIYMVLEELKKMQIEFNKAWVRKNIERKIDKFEQNFVIFKQNAKFQKVNAIEICTKVEKLYN